MSTSTSTQQRHTFWQEHVQIYHGSGLSKARYCRDNDIAYHQFIYWASKFADTKTPDNTIADTGTSKLIPVMLAEPEYGTGLQLHLPNGVLISGISAQSVGIVGHLIEQL